MIRFVKVLPSDLALMDITLRRADIDEMKASTGLEPMEALRQSIELSEWTEAAVKGPRNEMLCIFGLAEGLFNGAPWMVGSPTMLRHKVFLMAYAKKVIARMQEQYEVLANVVDSRNLVHIRWLAHMGFEFAPEKDVLFNDVLFHYFYKRR